MRLGKVANKVCFDHFNVKGLHNGHCGREKGRKGDDKGYRSCSEENVMCGLLHCQGGEQSPTAASTLQNTTFSRSLFKINGTEVECKSLNGQPRDLNADQMELVRDGTKCDRGKVGSFSLLSNRTMGSGRLFSIRHASSYLGGCIMKPGISE